MPLFGKKGDKKDKEEKKEAKKKEEQSKQKKSGRRPSKSEKKEQNSTTGGASTGANFQPTPQSTIVTELPSQLSTWGVYKESHETKETTFASVAPKGESFQASGTSTKSTKETMSLELNASERDGSKLENVSDHPLSPLNSVPTLDLVPDPAQAQDDIPRSKVQPGGISSTRKRNPSSSDDSLASPLPLGQIDDQAIAGKQGPTEDKKKQGDGLKRAAQRSQETNQKPMIAENRKLNGKLVAKEAELKKLKTDFAANEVDYDELQTKLDDRDAEVEKLQTDLAAKEAACNDFQAKLDNRDTAHEEHVKMKLDELRASHKKALAAKESTLQKALDQKDTELQSAEDELTKKDEEFQNQLKLKEDAYQAAVRSMVSKEAELLRLRTDVENKQTDVQNNRHEHEAKVKKLEQQMEESRSVHARAIENLRQQLVEKESEVEKTRLELEEKCKDFEEKVHQVEADYLRKIDEIEQLELQLTDSQLDHTATVEKLEKHLSEVQAKLDQKTEADQERKAQLEADAQSKIEELEEQLSKVQAKLKQVETDQETKGQQEADAQTKIEELEQQVKQTQEASQRQAEEKNTEMEMLRNRLVVEHKEDFDRKLLQKEAEIRDKLEEDIEKLCQQVKDLEKENEELAHDLEQEKLEQAQAVKIEDIHQQAAEVQEDQIDALKSEIEANLEKKYQDDLKEALAKQAQEKEDISRHLKEKLRIEHDRRIEELNRKHKEETKNQRQAAREQTRKLEQEYLVKLEEARRQRELFAQDISPGGSPKSSSDKLRAQLEIEFQHKYQQDIEQLQREKDDLIRQQTDENEELSRQLRTAEIELRQLQSLKPHSRGDDFEEKTQEIEQLKEQLKSQQELVHHFQHEYEHLKEQYGQLEVQALAKQHLSGSFIPSEGDDVAMPFRPTSPSQQRQPKPAAAKDTEVTIHSSLVEAANQISKFIDNESLNGNSKEMRLGHQQTTAATKALGLQVTPKPQYYVFAVFPASQHNYSTVLDYTAGPPVGGEREGRHESDEEDEFHQALESLSEQREMQGENDNRTDAEKLEEEKKRSESLLDELETLTNRLQELEATNTELKESARVAATKVPPSPAGVKQGEDPSKMFQQMKSRYLEQVTKTIDVQEAHKQELDELVQQHQKELQEWQVRYDRKKKELTDKIQEKDREVRELRTQDSVQDHPLLRQSFSCEDLPDDVDPKLHIAELKQALKDKEDKIEALSVQVSSFQKIASQHQQLESHVKLQSTSVMQLKRELEATKDELETSRKSSLKVSESNEELSKLQREKYEIEDERDILKQEMDAERDNVKSLKKQLADSQVAVAVLESSLKASPIPKSVGVDEKDQEIQLLKTGRQLFQVEVEESKRNLKRSQKALADTEKARLSLERKLKNVSDERDELSQSVTQLQASNRKARQRLNDVGKQLQVTMDHAEQLSKTVEEKTNKVNALEDKVKKLEEELEATKLQAQLYEEDFKQERRDREQAAGTKESEYGKIHVSMQKLSDELNNTNEELRRAQQIANEVREEKRAVIKKLELSVSEVQQVQRQSEQSERDFQAALQTANKEMNRALDEKTQLMSQMEHFQSLSERYEKQLQDAEVLYQQRQAELEQETTRLKGEAKLCKEELEDKAYLVAAEKLSLEEEHEKLTKEFKLKEKHLEIMATEKALIQEELNHEKNHSSALANELQEKQRLLDVAKTERKALEDEMRHTRATNAAFAVELQEDREKLETTIADTSRLHDEVLAKTQQVKQYKKQVDSYKAKLDEATNKLQVAQRDHQEQVKALEEDHQKLIEIGMAKMTSDKLTAENDLLRSQRLVATLQVEVKQWQEQKMSEGQVSEALRGEIRKREEAEQKFETSVAKCNLLLDKCDSQYQAIEKLKQTLVEHRVPVPKLDIGNISASMQNAQSTGTTAMPPSSSSPHPKPTARRRVSPHQPSLSPSRDRQQRSNVARHSSQFEQTQQGANHYPQTGENIRPILSDQSDSQTMVASNAGYQQPPRGHYGSDPTQSLRQRSITAPMRDQVHHSQFDSSQSQPYNQTPQVRRVHEDSESSRQFESVDNRADQQQQQQQHQSFHRDDQEAFDPQQQGGPPSPFIPSSNVSPSNSRATQGGANTIHPGYANVDIRDEPSHGGNQPSHGGNQPSHGGNQPSHGGSNAAPHNQPTNQDYENQETLDRLLAEEQQGSPYNQGYQQGNQGYNQEPQNYPPNQGQYSNQGYHQGQQYDQGNFRDQQYQLSKQLQPQSRQSSTDYYQHDYPPTSQAYNISHQGYDQTQGGYYDLHMQRQAGIGGVNPDQQAFRPRGGSHGAYSAQGPSPQGQYGGGVPPGGHNFQQTQPPVPVPRKTAHAEQDQLPPTSRVKQDSTVQENVLLQDIDTDISRAADFVKQEGEVVESLREVPLDPNLVCPLCMRGFKLGEIQRYRKHVNTCQGQ